MLEDCSIQCGIIAEGAHIQQAKIVRSVIGIRSMISARVQIANTVMMGADYYEQPADLDRNQAQGVPCIGIGPRTEIDGAIIDKNARIGADVVIKNEAGVQEAEAENYHILDGIVVIPKNAVIADRTVI